MALSDIFIFLVWLMVGGACWMLGYHYGVEHLKDRNKRMLQAIEGSNKIYAEWQESSTGTAFEDGYAAGIKNTLDTLNSFLERASDT